MLSMVEKSRILKTLHIFAETPDKILAEVAALLEDVEVKAGETIFYKGDMGDRMYIIVDGRVRVHDGDLTLNYRGKHEVFGELAVLDPEPRVASVTAVEDTHLLGLNQEPFYRLMANRIEVLHGVIHHLLAQYVRPAVRDLTEEWKYIQQLARITAAASEVEAGKFESESLDEVSLRNVEHGQLARVFQQMAHEVYAHEQRLRQKVQKSSVEIDEIKVARQVAEITGSELFQDLQKQVHQLRQSRDTEL